MRILLLTQYFPPEFGAAAARNSEHARFWAEAGHEVEVCTGFPNYPSGVIPPEYRGRWRSREARDGYTIHRSWVYATPNRAVWRRALASFSFFLSALLTGVFSCQQPDIIVASSGPFFVAPLGWCLSFLKRAPWVFEVRDVLPQQAVDVGMIRNPVIIKTLYAIEAFLYRHASAVVTVAAASRESLVARGFEAKKFFTIENGIREDLFSPGERNNEIRREFGWGNDFVGMYIGAHGVSQGLMTLLEAAVQLRDTPGVRIVFVGDGADKPRLEEWAQQQGLTNVQFLPLQPRDRMPALYAAADACFVPLRKGPYFTINIPSKMFEIMACARPIILGASGQAKALVDAAGAGIAVTPEDASAFVEAVRSLRSDPEMARRLGESGRAYVLENFSRRRQAARYVEILFRAIRPDREAAR